MTSLIAQISPWGKYTLLTSMYTLLALVIPYNVGRSEILYLPILPTEPQYQRWNATDRSSGCSS